MEIVKTDVVEPTPPTNVDNGKADSKDEESHAKSEKVFSDNNLKNNTVVDDKYASDADSSEKLRINNKKTVTITPEDKLAFLDSVISNTRFTKKYSLFGGRINITLRSVTQDELNAMTAWAYKQAVADPTWHLSGRGRKYALAAQVAMFNGTEMPPLEMPLFETLESDGKTTKPPAWVSRCAFWDDKSAGVIDAIIRCVDDFDSRYKILCDKAEDENFWKPDTP